MPWTELETEELFNDDVINYALIAHIIIRIKMFFTTYTYIFNQPLPACQSTDHTVDFLTGMFFKCMTLHGLYRYKWCMFLPYMS